MFFFIKGVSNINDTKMAAEKSRLCVDFYIYYSRLELSKSLTVTFCTEDTCKLLSWIHKVCDSQPIWWNFNCRLCKSSWKWNETVTVHLYTDQVSVYPKAKTYYWMKSLINIPEMEDYWVGKMLLQVGPRENWRKFPFSSLKIRKRVRIS